MRLSPKGRTVFSPQISDMAISDVSGLFGIQYKYHEKDSLVRY